MFDNITEEQKPRRWPWFVGGVLVYLFVLANVVLFTVAGGLSEGAAMILAPGIILMLSTKADPFIGFFGGVFLILTMIAVYGGLGLALQRILRSFGILQ